MNDEGISLYFVAFILSLIFFCCKALGINEWSWWAITSPIWGLIVWDIVMNLAIPGIMIVVGGFLLGVFWTCHQSWKGIKSVWGGLRGDHLK